MLNFVRVLAQIGCCPTLYCWILYMDASYVPSLEAPGKNTEMKVLACNMRAGGAQIGVGLPCK